MCVLECVISLQASYLVLLTWAGIGQDDQLTQRVFYVVQETGEAGLQEGGVRQRRCRVNEPHL